MHNKIIYISSFSKFQSAYHLFSKLKLIQCSFGIPGGQVMFVTFAGFIDNFIDTASICSIFQYLQYLYDI